MASLNVANRQESMQLVDLYQALCVVGTKEKSGVAPTKWG